MRKFKYSLESYALDSGKKYFLDEYSDKNKLKPDSISKSSREYCLWDCSKCGMEYERDISSRVYKNCGCPYCSGIKVNDTNCMWTTNPKVASLLENKEDGYIYTQFSTKRANFKCEDCGNVIEKQISQITRQGLYCPKCSDGVSYPEKIMLNILQQCGVSFQSQKSFGWSQRKRYDFYLPQLNCIIEMHGRQHYDEYCFETLGGKTLKEEQTNDKIKKKLALQNNIEKYIVINSSVSSIHFMKEQILNSDLLKFLPLEIIDWTECHKFACRSIVKLVSDLWNSGLKSTKEIVESTGIGRTTVVKYLKQGSELGYSDFSVSKVRGKAIVQLDLEGNYLNEYESSKEAGLKLNIHASGVNSASTDIAKSYKGYKWVKKADYEKMQGL